GARGGIGIAVAVRVRVFVTARASVGAGRAYLAGARRLRQHCQQCDKPRRRGVLVGVLESLHGSTIRLGSYSLRRLRTPCARSCCAASRLQLFTLTRLGVAIVGESALWLTHKPSHDRHGLCQVTRLVDVITELF